ncbi:protein phosphatase 1 regulatory subunit 3C-like [Rhopilema esculentum]|uniref:protein phosphatase 1 regulatory subunit 3C-like n=1 Tax=Rhopilema esculentum TaxID=499914 RepID=UPI0031D3E578|eukprot:gene13788-4717_t
MGSSKSKETVQTLCFILDSEQGKGKDRFIALENFSIHGRKVTGIVFMKNFDQNEDKWEVKVLFTFNSWESYSDKTCECIEDKKKTKMDGIKRFKFDINVPVGNSLEYAIFCRNAKSEFWDNNEYKNYTFSE